MREWQKREPIVITGGEGAVIEDAAGRKYLDANSSIWTNLHGHNHPAINAAIQSQLRKIAHSSALGLANEPASLLGAELIQAADRGARVSPPAAMCFDADIEERWKAVRDSRVAASEDTRAPVSLAK